MTRAGRQRGLVAPLVLLVVLFAGFMALGVWQVRRLAWKEALITRVDERIHAAAVAAPGPDTWPGIDADNAEYRHVTATGTFAPDRATLVQAVTDLGAGHWVLAPFQDARGFTVLVNRGFVSTGDAGAIPPPTGRQTITGLLRITEPGGAFLQSNRPEANRWFSRDVAAIAKARGLTRPAPYFIDEAAGVHAPDPVSDGLASRGAAAGASAGDGPVGGLTVIRFANNHLVYALTWFALAGLSAFGAMWLIRGAKRSKND
ncbi:MAG: SURF1 family protein [Caenibius sp.]